MTPNELPLTFEIDAAGACVVDPGIAPDPQLLANNLRALAQRQPSLAQRVASCIDPCPMRFERTDEDDALTAEFEGRALASRRKPLTEASRLAQKIDIESNGGLLILGMGLGHHVSAIAKRSGDACAIVVFEPDVALLRAVLERVDHTEWLQKPQSVIVTDPDDLGLLTADLQGLDALLSVGIDLIEHAPNSARLGDRGVRMIRTLTSAVGAMRMHVITAMVQADVTARNELMNLGHYVARAGIAELEGLCAGRPAILVAAGPSLKKNIERLRDPKVRERCVIICVQTVLKPLLDAGITPHFVTAIDYHEISRRFYEGLTPEDVEGVTLVAEARANAAILDAYPGDIRLPRDDFLDELLGTGPKHDGPDRGKLTAAATVAHLSYYLARHLGCDPVVLVGQDLAFTDGQYYGAGAAIHNVWACELNPMHSLETLEWQRIVRNKGHLHRVTDVMGRPVFTDDQMAAYLAQFERDFAPDEAKGLTIIDASDGVRKSHTAPMPLDDALARYAGDDAPVVPTIPRAAPTDDAASRRATADLVRKVRTQTKAIERKASDCVRILNELKDHQGDKARNNDLVKQTHALREEAQAHQPAFHLLMKMNQLGGFKRFKADRAIALAQHEDPIAEQRARIDRDIVNLNWIEEYAQVMGDLLSVSERALQGGPKRTRDVTPTDGADETEAPTIRVGAIIDTRAGTGDPTRVKRTVERLRAASQIDTVIVLTDEPGRHTDLPQGVVVESAPASNPATRRAIRAGRAWALDNWRSGLANLSVFDECLDPASIAPVCEAYQLDAVYCVGPDWTGLDAELTDRVVERHRESPGAHPIVFTQAPPGTCSAVVCAQAVREMAEGRTKKRGSTFATIGGVLGYVPLAPRHDPIARPGCVQIDDQLRNNARRTIEDITSSDGAHELVIDIHALTDSAARAHIDVFASTHPGAMVSFEGERDPVESPNLGALTAHARGAGLLTHVRTTLRAPGADDALLGIQPDVVSVDCASATRENYELLTGSEDFESVTLRLERLIDERPMTEGLPMMWVVPRITKRDAVYEEIEAFYDAWLVRAGAAVIDPLPAPIEGERIALLPVPAQAQERIASRRKFVPERSTS